VPLLFVAFSGLAQAVRIQQAVKAGSFYPAQQKELQAVLEKYTELAGTGENRNRPGKKLRAIVMPHAGYIYSGLTAAHIHTVLEERSFQLVVVLGPDHYVGIDHCVLTDAEFYQTPMGAIPISAKADILRKDSRLFRPVPASAEREHSVEVLLPFLQYSLHDFELLPLTVGFVPVKAVADRIAPLLDDDTLLVISSDLSHYLEYEQARKRDRVTLESILLRNPKHIEEDPECACGRIPLLILMRLALQYRWEPVLLHYSNSGDTAGTKERVVGYSAIAFFGEDNMNTESSESNQYTPEQGETLVRLARMTLEEELGIEPGASLELEEALEDPSFSVHRGTFVTLKIDRSLRGCIGSLSSREPVKDGVRRNAVNAAFHDPRFPRLTVEELRKVDIEVSVLTEPEPLEFSNPDDLVKKLRPGIDGVILQSGGRSATFLPQVWEQLPSADSFLGNLCMKAGLPVDNWKTEKVEVMIYQVQYFEE